MSGSDWKETAAGFERLLRLRSFPVGIKFYEDPQPLDQIKNLRTPVRKILLCQLITLARTVGWTVGITPDQLLSGSPCSAVVGFDERSEVVRDGTYRSAIWFESREEGRKCEDSFPHLPAHKFRGLALGPIASDKFDPDLVLIYATPAQMILIVNAIQWRDYERLSFFCTGESSCADYLSECFLSGKPSLTIPCFGERVYGHAQEDELVIAIPAGHVQMVLEGLANLSKRGVRYPIPFAGTQLDVVHRLPPYYLQIYGIEVQPLFRFWKEEKAALDGGV